MEDGPLLLPNGQLIWTPTEAQGGMTFLLDVEVTDSGGLSAIRSITITVDEVNSPLELESIPPMTVNEGEAATFLARAVDPDVPANTLTYELVSGPSGATIDPLTGRFMWVALDDGVYDGVVRVTDNGEPGMSSETSFTIAVNNVAPIASVNGPSDGVRGQPRAFVLRATDPSTVDQTAGFTYVIHWGDGTRKTIPLTPANGSGVALEHVYAKAGSFNITVTARDRNGAVSEVEHHPVRIRATQVQDGVLVIGGTQRDDSIVVTPDGIDRVKVQIGSNMKGVVGARHPGWNSTRVLGANRIVVFGQAGDDDIRIGGSIHLPTELHGGAGDDRLHGGHGFNVLNGGIGNDSLRGGMNRDILLGGSGADVLRGGGNDDILFGGYFRHGATIADDQLVISQMLDTWTSSAEYSDRVEQLRAALLPPANDDPSLAKLRNDYSADVLIGSEGRDWFLLQTPGRSLDKAIDRSRVEFVD